MNTSTKLPDINTGIWLPAWLLVNTEMTGACQFNPQRSEIAFVYAIVFATLAMASGIENRIPSPKSPTTPVGIISVGALENRRNPPRRTIWQKYSMTILFQSVTPRL